MSKTTYVNGDPSQGIAGTVVTAEFLNKVNNHYHTGRDVDGEGALAYAADAGAADAYVVTLSPALDAYVAGMPITFKAAYANTGASTIDVNDLGVKTIKKNGSEDLGVGDILAGQIVTVIYDGTNFQVMNAGAVAPVRDTVRNLVIKNNTSHPTYQMDITADEVILQDAYGNPARMLSLSVTADITASGAGGLDTGSEAGSTWYHMWAIMKRDGTKSVILSVSATAPTLPSGYVFKAYLGAVYNNASGNFDYLEQHDSLVMRLFINVLSGGTSESYVSINLASVIPPTAKEVWGSGEQYYSNQIQLLLASQTTPWSNEVIIRGAGSGSVTSQFILPLITAQTIYYRLSSSAGAAYVYINGWRY